MADHGRRRRRAWARCDRCRPRRPTPRPNTHSARSGPATPEAAKAQAEAWLKKAGKFDQAAFDKIWAEEDASVLDRTLATLELGSADAKAIMAVRQERRRRRPEGSARHPEGREARHLLPRQPGPRLRPRADQRPRVRGIPRPPSTTVKAEQTVDPAAYFFHRAVAEHALIKKDDALRSIVRLIDDVTDAPDRYKMLATIMFFDMGELEEGREGPVATSAADGQQRTSSRPGPRRQDHPGHPEEDRLPPR